MPNLPQISKIERKRDRHIINKHNKTTTLNNTTKLNKTTTPMCKKCHKSKKQRKRDGHITQKKTTILKTQIH